MARESRWWCVPVILAGLLTCAGAAASDLAEPVPPPNGWEFSFTPYGWMVNINADITAAGQTVDVNESFFQIVEKSDSLLALMGYFEARKDSLALFTDVVWYDLTFSGQGQFSTSKNVKINPFARLPNFDVLLKSNLSGKNNAEIDYQTTIVTTGAAYEVAKWNGSTSSTALDVLGGARYWNIRTDVSLQLSGKLSGDVAAQLKGLGFDVRRSFKGSRSMAVSHTSTLEWVDPFVGLQLRHRMGQSQELRLEGDVGGFGVGSEFSWGAVATYGFEVKCFGRPIHAVVGYRALYVDYSDTGRFGEAGINGV
jgi:hypothetical protein